MKKTHELCWPITDDKGGQLVQVIIHTLTLGARRALEEEHKNDLALLRACMSQSTGLTITELSRLVTPDYTTVNQMVQELMTSSAGELLEEFDLASPTLLVPIQGDDGREISQYSLKPPTVATTDLMDKHTDEWERTLFISMSCTGLSQAELERMSLPDWNQLQERLIDFLQKPADFFRPKTSKS